MGRARFHFRFFLCLAIPGAAGASDRGGRYRGPAAVRVLTCCSQRSSLSPPAGRERRGFFFWRLRSSRVLCMILGRSRACYICGTYGMMLPRPSFFFLLLWRYRIVCLPIYRST
ncbi:hypothetical protein F4802DRAFT_589883 [Xylaria palmicola]|nr:hypothetical protein F4802DRAFT_589883 [Xylaria palmicola]